MTPENTEFHLILQKAISVLSVREYSAYKLRLLLLKSFSDSKDTIEHVLDRLISDDFLSDSRFARAYVRHLAITTTKGPAQMVQALQKQGISFELAQKTITDELSDEEVYAIFQKVYEKQLRKHNVTLTSQIPATVRQKIFTFLYNKGFSSSYIQNHLS